MNDRFQTLRYIACKLNSKNFLNESLDSNLRKEVGFPVSIVTTLSPLPL